MESPIYSAEGKKIETITLPDNIFAVRWNADLVKQVVDSLLSSQRKNIAHTKSRGEVRGGGKKPWRQKGTGRARHGSIRSPIWVGGGVAHGPRADKNYERKVSKKMKAKALYSILSKKLKDEEILFVDKISLKEAKTKQAVAMLKNFDKIFSKKRNAAAIAMSEKNREVERAFKNLGNVEVVEARNLNPLTLLQYKYLILENPDVSLNSLPKISKAREAKKLTKLRS